MRTLNTEAPLCIDMKFDTPFAKVYIDAKKKKNDFMWEFMLSLNNEKVGSNIRRLNITLAGNIEVEKSKKRRERS